MALNRVSDEQLIGDLKRVKNYHKFLSVEIWFSPVVEILIKHSSLYNKSWCIYLDLGIDYIETLMLTVPLGPFKLICHLLSLRLAIYKLQESNKS